MTHSEGTHISTYQGSFHSLSSKDSGGRSSKLRERQRSQKMEANLREPQFLYRAEPSSKQEEADYFIQIGPSNAHIIPVYRHQQ